MLKVLEKHQGLPWISVSFEDVIHQPLKEAGRLADFLELELTEEKIEAIERLVIPRDRIAKEKKRVRSFFAGRLPRLIKRYAPRALIDRKSD
jgi:hypothetical protein